MRRALLLSATGLLAGCETVSEMFEPDPSRPATGVPMVQATVETVEVETTGDAADDPAVWVHPDDPGASLVFGTDKKAGLYAYDLSGAIVSFLPLPLPNNVDIRQDVVIGVDMATQSAVRGDLAVTSNRGDETVSLLLVGPEGAEELERFPVLRAEPYGICLGATPNPLVAVTHKTGEVDFYDAYGPSGVGVPLGTVTLPSQLEGCVFDEPNGRLFVGEEAGGIHVYELGALGLGPNAGTLETQTAMVDRVGGESGIVADVEGLTIYRAGATGGYLLASSQGNNTYAAYDRESLVFLGRFAVAAGEVVDGAEETDGIDAAAANLGPGFERGVLVVQDGFNDGAGTQNFKLIPFEQVEEALGL